MSQFEFAPSQVNFDLDVVYALPAWLGLGCVVLVFLIGRRVTVHRRFDVMDLLLYYFLIMFAGRPALLILGFDDPLLAEFLSADETERTLARALFAIAAWMALLCLGASIGFRSAGKSWLSDEIFQFESVDYLTAATCCLGLSMVVLVPLVLSQGSVAAITTASKLGVGEGVSNAVKLPSLIGSTFAAAGLILVMRQAGSMSAALRHHLKSTITLFALFVGCGYISFIYGARDAMVLGLLAISLGVLSGTRPSRGVLLKMALVGCVTLVAAFGFRYLRDAAVMADYNVTDEANVVRQISLAANLAYFDSFAMALLEYPDVYAFLGALPFENGLQGLPGVSTLLGPRDESFDNTAKEVMQNYYYWKVNGNPITAAGDWYVSFGYPGMAAGALISGLMLGWFQRKTFNYDTQPLCLVFAVFIVARFMPFGLNAHSPNVLLRYFLPVLLVVLALTLFRSLRLSAGTARPA